MGPGVNARRQVDQGNSDAMTDRELSGYVVVVVPDSERQFGTCVAARTCSSFREPVRGGGRGSDLSVDLQWYRRRCVEAPAFVYESKYQQRLAPVRYFAKAHKACAQ